MKEIFWNEGERRLRVFWRFLIVAGSYVVITRLSNHLGDSAFTNLDSETVVLAANIIELALIVGLLFLAAHFIDKRPFSAYGLKLRRGYWWLDFGVGVLIIAALFTLVLFAASWVGWARFEQGLGQRENVLLLISFTRPLLGILVEAVTLELFYRGYLVTNLGEGFNFANGLLDPFVDAAHNLDFGFANFRVNQALFQNLNYKLGGGIAWILSSLLFTFARVGDVTPTMTLLSDLLKGGILLALAFILTRQLGMSVGMSFGWGFMRSHIFGFHVRGLVVVETSLYAVLLSGPELITGGDQGFEGSLLAVIILAVGGVLVSGWVKARSQRIKRDFDPWVFEYQKLPD